LPIVGTQSYWRARLSRSTARARVSESMRRLNFAFDLDARVGKLPSGDRQFIILPGTAHSVVLATNRQLFWHVTRAFLTMPAPIAT